MKRALVVLAALGGCGDNLAPPTPDAPPVFVEAMPGSGVIPQVIDSGGPTFTAPIVQPIFFANEADVQPYVEAFLPQLASSSFWTAIGAEYGIGPLTVMPSIVSTDTVPTTDPEMEQYLATQLDGLHMGWPLADPQSTIYMAMLPAGQMFQGACSEFAGYHTNSGGNSDFAYAVIADCGAPSTDITALDEVTATISHELIEASTDPKPRTMPAYEATDRMHLAWGFAAGSEVADMCEWTVAAQQRLVGTYLVQRSWSNAAALAGHDPCVPALGGPYINAAPTLGDVTVAMANGMASNAIGISIPTGTSQQIDLHLFSDAPSDPWNISVIDGAQFLRTPITLAIEYGRTTSGSNGDTVSIVVRRERPDPGGSALFVESQPADDPTRVTGFWWIYVQ